MQHKEKINARLISQNCADEIADYYVFSRYTRREIAEQLGLSINQLGHLLERGKGSARVHELYKKYPSLHWSTYGQFPEEYKEKVVRMVKAGVDIGEICEYGKLDKSTIIKWVKDYESKQTVSLDTQHKGEQKYLEKAILSLTKEDRKSLKKFFTPLMQMLEEAE